MTPRRKAEQLDLGAAAQTKPVASPRCGSWTPLTAAEKEYGAIDRLARAAYARLLASESQESIRIIEDASILCARCGLPIADGGGLCEALETTEHGLTCTPDPLTCQFAEPLTCSICQLEIPAGASCTRICVDTDVAIAHSSCCVNARIEGRQ